MGLTKNLLLICREHEVVCHTPTGITLETKFDNHINVCHAPWEIIKPFCINESIQVQVMLIAFAISDRFEKMRFVAEHFRMLLNDMLPALIGEIDFVSIPVYN